MARLTWKNEYSVGDHEIDRQHIYLFKLIDQLESTDQSREKWLLTFEELDRYVSEHFSDEEEKLSLCEYPYLKAHLRQHDEFRQWLEDVKATVVDMRGDLSVMAKNIHQFLQDWLLTHILQADQAYKDWIIH